MSTRQKILLLAMVLAALTTSFTIVHAEELPVSVYLEAEQGTTEVLRTNDINLVVKASNVQDLYTMQLELAYDAQRLKLSPEDISNLAWAGSQNEYSAVEVNAETGTVKLLYSIKGKTTGVSGDLCLVRLTFNALRIGNTNVEIRKIKMVNSSARDINTYTELPMMGINVLPNPLTVGLTGTKRSNDWYITNVNVEITDMDAQVILYTIDGIQHTYSEPFTMNVSGIHNLAVTTNDGFGYIKEKSMEIQIDTIAPVIEMNNMAEGIDYTDNIIPVIDVSDAQSGIFTQCITLDGQNYVPGTPVTEQGTHVLTAAAVDFAGNETVKAVTFKIYASTVLTVSATPCEYSGHVTLIAQLTSGNDAVPAGLISFRVNGVGTGTVETDAAGMTQLEYHVDMPAGVYQVSVSYEQDDTGYFRASVAQTDLEVLPEKADIIYTGDYLVQYPNTIMLSAQVIQDEDASPGDLTHANIVFDIFRVNGDGTTTPVENRTVSADVYGAASIVSSYDVGVYSIIVSIADDGYYTQVEDIAIVPLYNPDGGFATGGGWIDVTNPEEGDPGKANFGFNAKYKDAASTGNLEFQYRDGDINLKSTGIDWLTISSTNAQFQGTATIKGWGGIYTFRVSCTDNKDSNKPDKFTIKIWPGTDTGANPVYKALNQDLGGGNILIKTKE